MDALRVLRLALHRELPAFANRHQLELTGRNALHATALARFFGSWPSGHAKAFVLYKA